MQGGSQLNYTEATWVVGSIWIFFTVRTIRWTTQGVYWSYWASFELYLNYTAGILVLLTRILILILLKNCCNKDFVFINFIKVLLNSLRSLHYCWINIKPILSIFLTMVFHILIFMGTLFIVFVRLKSNHLSKINLLKLLINFLKRDIKRLFLKRSAEMVFSKYFIASCSQLFI